MDLIEILSDEQYMIADEDMPELSRRIKKLVERLVPREEKRKFAYGDTMVERTKCMTHNACRDDMIRRIRKAFNIKYGEQKS